MIIVFVAIYDLAKYQKGKLHAFYFILTLLILLAGLRYRVGLDTVRYMQSYANLIPPITDLNSFSFLDLYVEPLWFYMNSFYKTFTDSFVLVQLTHALFVNSVIFWFIKKRSKYLFIPVLFYYLFAYTNFNFEVMRESIAVALFLLAIGPLEKRNYAKYYLICVIAFFFHSSAIITFLFPLAMKLRLNYKTVGLFFLVGLGGQFLLSILLENIQLLFFTERIESRLLFYAASEHLFGQGLNINGIIQYLFVTAFMPLAALYYAKKGKFVNEIFESSIVLIVLITVLTINILLFYRLINYFIVFYIIVLSNGIYYIRNRRTKRSLVRNAQPVFLALLILFQTYGYFQSEGGYSEQIKVYHRYYPYSTYFDQKTFDTRETLLKSRNVSF